MSIVSFEEQTRKFLSWFTADERRQSGTFLGADPADIDSSALHSGSPDVAKIAIVDKRSEGQDRTVTAIEDIEPGTSLFTVSHTDILCISTSRIQSVVGRARLRALPPWAALVVALIYEHGLGVEGKWWPYLALLPQSFDTLMYWNYEELQELQDSHVIRRIGREDAENVVEDQIWPIIREHASHFGCYAEEFSDSERRQAPEVLFELSHRFATLIMAHAFDLDEADEESMPNKDTNNDGFIEESDPPKGMVPFADMLNTEVEELSNARLFHDENSVSMVTTKLIKAGDEVLNEYGSLPNAEMLRCYGCTTTLQNRYDVAELELESLIGLSKKHYKLNENQISKRLNLAEKWDVVDESFDLVREYDGNFPIKDELLLTTMLLTSDDDEYQAHKQAKRLPPAKLNRKTAHLLLEAVQQRQKKYSTTLANDKVLLKEVEESNYKMSKRQIMALKVRLGEKEVLAKNSDLLKSWLNDTTRSDTSEINFANAKKRKT